MQQRPPFYLTFPDWKEGTSHREICFHGTWPWWMTTTNRLSWLKETTVTFQPSPSLSMWAPRGETDLPKFTRLVTGQTGTRTRLLNPSLSLSSLKCVSRHFFVFPRWILAFHLSTWMHRYLFWKKLVAPLYTLLREVRWMASCDSYDSIHNKT